MNMNRTPPFSLRLSALTLLAGALLPGCATDGFRQTDAQADQDIQDAGTLQARSRTLPSAAPLVWVDEPWVDPRPVRVSTKAQASRLPACSLTLAFDGTISLYEAGQRITRSCGIPVAIMPDALTAMSGQSGGTTRAMTGALPVPDDNGRPSLSAIGATSSPALSVSGGTLSDIEWQGPLGGLLDQIASRLGLNWRLENGRIEFHYLDTRTFRIKVLNAVTAMNASLTGTTSSSAGGDSTSVSGSQDSGQSTTVRLESKIHEDIAASVKAMVSPAGSWHLAGSTGELVVTDVPQVLDRVERYIDNLNIRMNRMVRLQVSVYSVQQTRSSQTALDWSVVADRLGSFSASLTGAATSTTRITSAGINVLNGRFAGTTALLRALETQGKVSVVLSHETTTTSLVPAPFQIAGQMVYLKQQNTTVSDSYATTTLEPGSVTTGTQMTLLPDIRDEGDIQLQLNFSHSDPAQLRKVESDDGNTKMEMPYTTLRSLSQRVNLRTGQTLIVSGYNARSTSSTREGSLTPDFTAAGGGKVSELDDTTLIIAVTPVLL